MIYYISNNKPVFEWGSIKQIPIQEALDYLESLDTIGVDTETTGLDCHFDTMLSIQLGDEVNQYVFDLLSIDIRHLKHILESEKLLILQNAKFDLKFFYKKGIYPNKIYDTFLAEIIITNGLQYDGRALNDLVWKYCNVTLDKSIRNKINKEGLSERVIIYGAKDVEHLSSIRKKQLKVINFLNLKRSVDLDNTFVKVLAYIEFCGIKLDIDKWQNKCNRDKKDLDNSLEKLNSTLYSIGRKEYFDTQLNMFSTERKCLINWNSSKQVIKLFKKLGINTIIKEKGVEKNSIEADVLVTQKGSFPIIAPYLEYKEIQKVVSTYGENWFNCINKNTGRIHTIFKQLMDTGRLSCGGDNMPNLQNIPSDEETRSCFIAESGNILIDADFSGQEQIVLANFCKDKNILEFYNKYGINGDMHGFVASLIYKELNNLPLEEIKKNHKDKRQIAKSAGFAINYGGNGQTIAKNLGVSVEVGAFVYDSYFKAFYGLKEYFKRCYESALYKGYIEFNSITHRKYFIPNFTEFKDIDSETRDTDFWVEYRENKDDLGLRDKVKKYFKTKGEIQRKSQNFPIQGSSSDISKYSGVLFFNTIKSKGWLGKVKIVNMIHDEWLVESPIELAEEVKLILEECMKKAGEPFCSIIPLSAEAKICSSWEH